MRHNLQKASRRQEEQRDAYERPFGGGERSWLDLHQQPGSAGSYRRLQPKQEGNSTLDVPRCWKVRRSLQLQIAELGIEPRIQVSETRVLPLHHSAEPITSWTCLGSGYADPGPDFEPVTLPQRPILIGRLVIEADDGTRTHNLRLGKASFNH